MKNARFAKACGFDRAVAFTLIELLIVIAILTVLVALLFPALRRAKDAAKKAICVSNLHQIGVLMKLYESDSNGYITPSSSQHDMDLQWDVVNYSLCVMTTTGGGTCPYGNMKLYPATFGWFYAMGYLDAVGSSPGADIGILRCPGTPQYVDQFGQKWRDKIQNYQAVYQAYSRITVQLKSNHGVGPLTDSVFGGAWDCVMGYPLTSYVHRGWGKDFNTIYVGRADDWKPRDAVVVDYDRCGIL